VLSADEPEALGGRDTGPDPYELVLAGLAACTAMTVRMYARRKGWPLAHVEVRVNLLQEPGPDGEMVDRFERVLDLQGDLSLEERARLITIADRCPVSQTLKNGAEVTAVEEASTGDVQGTG